MYIEKAIHTIIAGKTLSENDMMGTMEEITSGTASQVQIAGFLIGLETRGPTPSELTTATKVLRQKAETISLAPSKLIDIVGTGGDGARTFNISTTAAFIVAAAGGLVAKHGNRAVSSSSGSADVLEQAGFNLNITPDQAKQCISQIGISFLFAPQYHPALKQAAQTRKALGVRTFFNLLGPLTNPANADYLVIGVFAKKWLTLVAQVLANLGCQHAAILHGDDGLDEISISAPTQVAEVVGDRIKHYVITPEQFGFSIQSNHSLQVSSPAESLQIMEAVLKNQPGPARDIVLLNAGMAIYIANMADSIGAGIAMAKNLLASGKALAKFEQLAKLTQSFRRG